MTLRQKHRRSWKFIALLSFIGLVGLFHLVDAAISNRQGVPSIIGKNLTVNGTLTLDGQADAVQLTVQGNATQTADFFVVEDSTGSNAISVGSTGLFSALYSITVGQNNASGMGGDTNFYLVGSDNILFTTPAGQNCTDASGCIRGALRTNTANVEAHRLEVTVTADVSGVIGLQGGISTAGINLTTPNVVTAVNANVEGNNNASETGYFVGHDCSISGIHANATSICHLSSSSATEVDFATVDKAGVWRNINNDGAAESWTFEHDNAAAGDLNGATMTFNGSDASGTGVNGGFTWNVPDTGSGGAGEFLVQGTAGGDSLRIQHASTGVATISIGVSANADVLALGDANAVFSLASTGLDVSTAGALSGVTSLAMGGALSGVTTLAASGAITAANLRGTLCATTTNPPTDAAFVGGFASADWTFNGVTARWEVAGTGGTTGVQFQVACGATTATCAIPCTTAANTPTRCTLTVNNSADQVCTIMVTSSTDCLVNPSGDIVACADYNYAP